jgi:MATE family multidrug resistance protein
MSAASRIEGVSSGLRVELEALVRLAAPVVVVQLGMMAMGAVDTMMLGRFSAAGLAAGALGHIYSMSFLIAAQGILMALDPLVSQAHGAGDPARVAAVFQRGVVQALLLCLPLSAVMLDAEPLLALLGQPTEIRAPAADYVRLVALGNPAMLLFVVVRQSLQAMAIVRPAVFAIVAANLVNVAVNWVLIFGNLGAPELGVAGAAVATALSRWTLLLVLLAAARPQLRAVWRGFDRAAGDVAAHRRMLAIGLPIGAQVALEMWVFVAVGLLAGRLGVRELGGHQIALNLASLSFMVPLGIGGAAAALVGQAIGRQDPEGARRAARAALLVGVGVMAGSGLLFALARHPLARAFTGDPELAALGASLIGVAAVFQIFDGLQVVSLGVLRGAADTKLPAVINLLGYWGVGLPLGAWLGLGLGWGAPGLWWGLTAGLAVVGTLLFFRVRRRFQ